MATIMETLGVRKRKRKTPVAAQSQALGYQIGGLPFQYPMPVRSDLTEDPWRSKRQSLLEEFWRKQNLKTDPVSHLWREQVPDWEYTGRFGVQPEDSYADPGRGPFPVDIPYTPHVSSEIEEAISRGDLTRGAEPQPGFEDPRSLLTDLLSPIEEFHQKVAIPGISDALGVIPVKWEPPTPGGPYYPTEEQFVPTPDPASISKWESVFGRSGLLAPFGIGPTVPKGDMELNLDAYRTPEGGISLRGVTDALLMTASPITAAGRMATGIAGEILNVPIDPQDTIKAENIRKIAEEEERRTGVPMTQRRLREIGEELYKLPPGMRALAEELFYLGIPEFRTISAVLKSSKFLKRFQSAGKAADKAPFPATGGVPTQTEYIASQLARNKKVTEIVENYPHIGADIAEELYDEVNLATEVLTDWASKNRPGWDNLSAAEKSANIKQAYLDAFAKEGTELIPDIDNIVTNIAEGAVQRTKPGAAPIIPGTRKPKTHKVTEVEFGDDVGFYWPDDTMPGDQFVISYGPGGRNTAKYELMPDGTFGKPTYTGPHPGVANRTRFDKGEDFARGKQALKERMDLEERLTGSLDPESKYVADEFLDMLPDHMIEDLGSSYRKVISRKDIEDASKKGYPVTVATYEPDIAVINIFKRISGRRGSVAGSERTIVHEIAHHLEQFVPSAEAKKLVSQFNREMSDRGQSLIDELIELRKSKAGEARDIKIREEAVKAGELTPELWPLPKKVNPLTDAEKKLLRDSYRYTNFKEWFAEVMTDKALRDILMEIPEKRNVIQKVLDAIKELAVSVYNTLLRRGATRDEAEKVYKNLINNKFDPAERRPLYDMGYPLEEQIPSPGTGGVPGVSTKEPWQMPKREFDETSGTVFHGTKAEFERFELLDDVTMQSDPGLVGRGVYFTPTKEQAEQFAKNPLYGYGDMPRVISARVELKNPAIIEDGVLPDGRTLTEAHPRGITQESGEAVNKALKDAGYDGAIFRLSTAVRAESGESVITQVVTFDPKVIKTHRELVEQALAEGKSIPDEVLRDYPDLTTPSQAPSPATGGVPGTGFRGAGGGQEIIGGQPPRVSRASRTSRDLEEMSDEELVQEAITTRKDHISKLDMEQTEFSGTYLNTEAGNRYLNSARSGSKLHSANVTITNPRIFRSSFEYSEYQNDFLPNTLPSGTGRTVNLRLKDGTINYDELAILDWAADLKGKVGPTIRAGQEATAQLKREGYDSVYLPEADINEGILVVFDKNNVQIGPGQTITKDLRNSEIKAATEAYNQALLPSNPTGIPGIEGSREWFAEVMTDKARKLLSDR